MDVIDIIKESLKYPVNNYKEWGIFAIIFLIMSLINYSITTGNSLLGLAQIIVGLFIAGLSLSIIRNTVDGSYDVFDLDILKNFIDGIKLAITQIIYYIIPTIIAIIVAIFTGLFDEFGTLMNETITAVNNGSNYTAISMINTPAASHFLTSLSITILVFAILSIIFTIFSYIAEARLAETGSIGAALNISEIFGKISTIGWGKYIIFLIVTVIVLFIISIIAGIISLIPTIGMIISGTIIGSYTAIFISCSLGLIYREA